MHLLAGRIRLCWRATGAPERVAKRQGRGWQISALSFTALLAARKAINSFAMSGKLLGFGKLSRLPQPQGLADILGHAILSAGQGEQLAGQELN